MSVLPGDASAWTEQEHWAWREICEGRDANLQAHRWLWQGSRLLLGGAWALLGCTVVTGFEYEDYDSTGRDELTVKWPEFAAQIAALTRY